MRPITVTSPLLPPLDELHELLQDIWRRGWVTNMGKYHELLESALVKYLGVPNVSLFTNGTIPLITALQALDIRDGEVITTPYSFVATTHALHWNGITPVFADIKEEDCNIDPARIEEAITPRTKAILPVHVYGNPCDTEAIQAIADKYGLKVIYDAAHAFGVRKNGKSILVEGDLSSLSFHATKVFNTLEGGAIVCKDESTRERLNHLRNFGFEDETTVEGFGINGKMDEVRAAVGLLNLSHVDEAIQRRGEVAREYRERLKQVDGIRLLPENEDVDSNHAYFPIFVDRKIFGRSRDELYQNMKQQGIFARRYFYPLISNLSLYCNLPSAVKRNLPVANKASEEVLCLPLHHSLSQDNITSIINCIVP